MGLFSKNKIKNDNLSLIKKLNGRQVDYVLSREKSTYEEQIIGKNGHINVLENDVVIMCENGEVFRCPIEKLKAWELMSLNGVVFEFDSEKTIISHYSYYRK